MLLLQEIIAYLSLNKATAVLTNRMDYMEREKVQWKCLGTNKKAMQYSEEGFRFRPSGYLCANGKYLDYGPWNYAGPPGPVRFESDDALNPWEYGSSRSMNFRKR